MVFDWQPIRTRNVFAVAIILLLLLHAVSFRVSFACGMCSRESAGVYLDKMVARKRLEVDSLLRRHKDPNDPLIMRSTYMASKANSNAVNALKRPAQGPENYHTLSVVVDMKRRSPTIPDKREIVDFSSAGKFAVQLASAGVDCLLVNTDEIEYGGRFSELKECVTALKGYRSAVIWKDVIIHPIQIAMALENGADGVLLIQSVVGGDLAELLDSCTVMGTQAVVEVHTPNELEFALNQGATIFLVNMWDRMTGRLYKEQAKGMASMMPMNSIAIAAGSIKTVEEVAELGFFGYDGVVLGRHLPEIDLQKFISGTHQFQGVPRGPTFRGMKGLPWL